MATLLSLLAAVVTAVVCMLVYDASIAVLLVLIPISVVIFCISLLIGHFLSEPLSDLAKKMAAFRSGAPVTFEPDGRMYEADLLTSDFKRLVQTTTQQQHDLAIKERRQNEFISDVAHELRTPLTAIRGNAEMLADPDLPPSLHEKFCGIIVNESERLSRLTHDLLTLQRIESSPIPETMQRVNLHDLANSVVDALSPILHDRQANTGVSGEAPDVLGNPDRTEQVLVAILDNAMKYTPEGGTIDLIAEPTPELLRVTVKDTGPGIAQADLPHVFERFYKADKAHQGKGTGLGLAIAHEIMKQLGEELTVHSVQGEGSAFTFTLHFCPQTPPSQPLEEGASEPALPACEPSIHS